MKALNALSEAFLQAHPTQAALVLEEVDGKPLARFLGRLTPPAAAKVFEHLDPEAAARCLRLMTPPKAAAIVEHLSAHVLIVVLRQVPEKRRELILSALREDVAEQTRRMLRYSDESVATLMTTDMLTLAQDMKAAEAMRRIRRSQREFDGEIYVLDRTHRLVGVTTLHAVLKAPRDQSIASITNSECARVPARTPQRSLVMHPLWSDFNSVAVVDGDGVLLGVIDHRTVAKAGERLLAGSGHGGIEAALALGELYWMGLTGMLDGLARRGRNDTLAEDFNHGSSAPS